MSKYRELKEIELLRLAKKTKVLYIYSIDLKRCLPLMYDFFVLIFSLAKQEFKMIIKQHSVYDFMYLITIYITKVYSKMEKYL